MHAPHSSARRTDIYPTVAAVGILMFAEVDILLDLLAQPHLGIPTRRAATSLLLIRAPARDAQFSPLFCARKLLGI